MGSIIQLMTTIGMDMGLVIGGYALGFITAIVWFKELQRQRDAKKGSR